MSLPKSAEDRKKYPVATGVLDYFPDAIAEIARVSQAGNAQHGLGPPLRWDRSKSSDEADALMRHFMERGTIDSDGLRHTAKLAWRACAMLQKELEDSEHKAKELRFTLPVAAMAEAEFIVGELQKYYEQERENHEKGKG